MKEKAQVHAKNELTVGGCVGLGPRLALEAAFIMCSLICYREISVANLKIQMRGVGKRADCSNFRKSIAPVTSVSRWLLIT